jgi:ribosomal protein S6--L-glutamate ligase
VKIGILSRGTRLYSTGRLKQAAIERGHQVRVLDTLRFALQVEPHDPDLFYNNKNVPPLDAVIPRIGASITPFGCAVVRQFEQMGVFVLNASRAIAVSRDKLRSLQALSRRDIGLPSTAFARRKEDILPAIERVGGTPIIIKLLEGTQGVGVILAESLKVAEAIIETLHGAKQSVLIQKFVAESKGKDVRAFVVGGKVVAAMRRTAVGQEFRSNVHRGGTTEGITLSAEYARTAVRAAQIMGLHVAGVDLLEGADGPQVLEVNSSPGLEGIEKATGVDVAGRIIEHLETQIRFPEIDVRERLSLNVGYSVAEFAIAEHSELAGRTLAETHLRDREVVVLSIRRQGIAFPNPSSEQEILPGDVLLCYGKMLTLKSLIPAAPKRRRKKRSAPRKANTP